MTGVKLTGGLECRSLDFVHGSSWAGEQQIIQGISAHFHAGRIALITGATGAGKSTLLHILAGLIRPTQGIVFADGCPVSRWTGLHRDIWRRKVGIVFQNNYFLRDLTVLENVILPIIPRRFAVHELRKQGLLALESVDISHHAGKVVSALSGGERQRLSLARALISQPEFLIADEPTAHQDGSGCRNVFHHLKEARERRATVVVASHDPRFAEAGIADDQWLLSGGRLERME